MAAKAAERRSKRGGGSGDPVDGLLDVLYRTIGDPQGWPAFIEALTASYPGGRASLALHDAALRHDQEGVTAGWEPDRIAAYYAHYAKLNPWLPRVKTRPIGKVVPAEYMLPRRDLLQTELYQDFLRPLGLDSGLGVTLQQDGSRVMLLSILYPSRLAERDRAALSRLQRLVPHVLRAAQLSRQFACLSGRAAAAEAVLQRLDIAMFLIGNQGKVVFMTEAAEAFLRQGDAVVLQGGVLRPRRPAEAAALHRMIADAQAARHAVDTPPGGMMRLSRDGGAAPLEVLVSPVDGPVVGDAGGPFAAVIMRAPSALPACDQAALRALYGLTRAEARLMAALVAGDTLDSAARQFGVGRETLRSQLKSLGAKTGTASQIDLVRLGARSLAAGRPARDADPAH